MKTNRDKTAKVKEAAAIYAPALTPSAPSMLRTQIYLTSAEYDFLQAEANRRGAPMAAVIRSFIDEKMRVPSVAWRRNPLLEPTPEDREFQGHADGAIEHDHYVYGSQRRRSAARKRS